jgi:hypothetical protein
LSVETLACCGRERRRERGEIVRDSGLLIERGSGVGCESSSSSDRGSGRERGRERATGASYFLTGRGGGERAIELNER